MKFIYADFNGIRNFNDVDHEYIDLCGYGTIASLNHYSIKLETGLKLTLFEPGDIEVEAVAAFFPKETDEHNPLGKWYGKFKKGSIRDSRTESKYSCNFVCFKCRNSLEEYLNKVGRQYKEICPFCNTPIMYPLLPPKDVKNINEI
ncbi:MAG: hypothetical protein OEY96_12900 [Gammaproteobacteria bacterium]|nr:hypothetical protein [Gammaproteobacteria bacterium]